MEDTLIIQPDSAVADAAKERMARFEELAHMPMALNRPTPASAKALMDELLFQQAVQAYLWAMPLVNTLGMKFGSEAAFGSGYNVLPIWKERLDPKTLVTTPNSDVLYAMSYVDMGETGPIMIEAPAHLQGILLDFWQRPIPVDGGQYFGDLGIPGPDKGAGGKFLVVPPGHDGKVPTDCYVYRSATRNLFVFLRGFYMDPGNLGPTVALMEQAKIYPLNAPEADRKPMSFPNASGVSANMLPRTDVTAFDQIKWLLDSEGSNLASEDGLGLLANIGLVEGMPFKPDARTRAILDAAARTAYKMSRVIGLSEAVGDNSYLVWPDRRWANPFNNAAQPGPHKSIDLSWRNTAHGYTDIEQRIWMFTNYYSLSPGMVSQTAGQGASYWMAYHDAAGEPLSGDTAYKVTLPPNAPVKLFWSLTLYEAENASGLAIEARRFPSLGSRDEPDKNADGTIDLFIGPKAPAGKEANWLPTAPGRGFFAILRLYGPEEAGIDYSWKPSDFVKIG